MLKNENSSCSETTDPSMVDFGFGFNDTDFSDRALRFEITEDSLDSKDFSKDNVVQVKTIHISSIVVAASSPFFYKLFKNGMRESQEKDLTLRINASVESALMDILKFIYSHTLSATTTPDLLAVLIAADKFEVTSCVRYCTRLLQKVPMSLESALLYLQLPSSVSLSESVQPLIVATKEDVVAQYSDFDEFREELMDLPLCAVEVVLGTDGLQVNSEDDVFDFILEWASVHYHELNERRKVIADHLVQCICFHFMSCSKLREALVSPVLFGHEEVSKLVLKALFLKAEVPYLRNTHSIEVANTNTNRCSLVRNYKYRPLKVVQFEFAQPRCIVYFALRKEECVNQFESPPRVSDLHFKSFCLGGRWLYFMVGCCTAGRQPDSFALYLDMTTESESCNLYYEIAVIKKSSTVFQKMRNGNFRLTGMELPHSLFDTSWRDFVKEDSEYFIDGFLHLRADLIIK